MSLNDSHKNLDNLFKKWQREPLMINSDSRIVFMSDCHRGNGGHGDDFAHNRIIFIHSLTWYREEGFTYVEVGDGEELWENSDFSLIHWAYSDVYIRLGYLHSEGRFILIWGNHNNLWRQPDQIAQYFMPAMWFYFDGRPSPILANMDPGFLHRILSGEIPPTEDSPIFNQLRARDAIVLKHSGTGMEILVTHGHQGELFGDRLWPLSRFLVRHVWRILQNAGFRPRITPAGNYALMKKVESRLTSWCRRTGIPLIAGHTHQPEFPEQDDPPYFNCGSCVHPRCITGIEIQEDKISLVKWHLSTPLAESRGEGSEVCIIRTILQGPMPLNAYAGNIPETGHRRPIRRKVKKKQRATLTRFLEG